MTRVDLIVALIFLVIFALAFKFYNLIFIGIKDQNKNFIRTFIVPSVTVGNFTYGRATGTYQKGFQPAASDVAEGIISFHDDLMFFIVFICIFVFSLLGMCLTQFSKEQVGVVSQRFVHAATLEIVWTLLPAVVLFIIAIPSFALLYTMDEVFEPFFTVKVIGHQWYWSYEMTDGAKFQDLVKSRFVSTDTDEANISFAGLSNEGFDSYLVPDDELNNPMLLTKFRLLTVDNHLVVPVKTPTRFLVTSADVLHSWAIPSLGVKIDACPGRLNQTSVLIKYVGYYYGQCSEICGVNHGFMPIGIIAPSLVLFNDKSTYSTVDLILSGFDAASSETEDQKAVFSRGSKPTPTDYRGLPIIKVKHLKPIKFDVGTNLD
jgi:cytochrome c oxidase subunit 2